MYFSFSNDFGNDTDRIIIIGDVHGDIKRFKEILIKSEIINTNLEWIAEPPNTYIIQLGDQIDSLNRLSNEKWEVLSDFEMIYFTEHLNDIARIKGGAVISLIGNHELMNIIGDFSYVSPQNRNELRIDLFKAKTGSIGLILAKRPLIVKIKDLIFCHAKLGLEHLELLKKRNKDIFYLNYLWKNYMENGKIALEDKQIFDEIIIGHNGILWNRHDNNKNQTEELFKQLGVKYMFLGHTALEKITIIDNQIFYCDTGLSRAFGTNKYQYLDINNRNINIKTIE
jgi:hypothetical protein